MSERFWMVVNVSHNEFVACSERVPLIYAPRFVHHEQPDAEREALRLAQATGDDFVVLQATSFTQALPFGNHYKLVDCAPAFSETLRRSASLQPYEVTMSTPTPTPQSKVALQMERDTFPLTEKGAERGIVHLRRVIHEESVREQRNRQKIERLQRDNEARRRHIQQCLEHKAELEAIVDGEPIHATEES